MENIFFIVAGKIRNMENSAPLKIQVIQADWLKPGWIFALRRDSCDATLFGTPRGDSLAFAQSVLAKLEAIRQTPNTIGVFLSNDDCALVTEHFPDYFYRTNGPADPGRSGK